MGCFNHYFVVCLQKNKLFYLDSLNTPINEIMEGKVTIPNASRADHQRIEDMKSAIEIILNIYQKNKTLES